MSGFITGLVVMVHVMCCIALMAAILLQSGKGGGLAGTFGAGSSQTLFGGRGAATFLSRATTVLAVVFFLTSLTLGLQASRSAGGRQSLIQQEARRQGQGRSATEGAGAPMTSPAPMTGTTSAPVAGPRAGPSPVAEPSPAETPSTPPGVPAPAGQGTQAPATGGQ